MLIQAMSSPTVQTFQPSDSNGDFSMARLVLPHALGQPALVAAHRGGDPQREALLPEQRIAAIAGPDAPDRARIGKVHDEAPLGRKVADRVEAGHPVAAVGLE